MKKESMKKKSRWHSFWKGYRRGLRCFRWLRSLKRNYRKLQITLKVIRKQYGIQEEFIMADIKPFRAVRPRTAYAAEIAALPYDVYNREEARKEVEKNPMSF